jgi:hypothetical protein
VSQSCLLENSVFCCSVPASWPVGIERWIPLWRSTNGTCWRIRNSGWRSRGWSCLILRWQLLTSSSIFHLFWHVFCCLCCLVGTKSGRIARPLSAFSIHCKVNSDVNMGVNSHPSEVAIIGMFLACCSSVTKFCPLLYGWLHIKTISTSYNNRHRISFPYCKGSKSQLQYLKQLKERHWEK